MKKLFLFMLIAITAIACSKDDEDVQRPQGILSPLHNLGQVLSFSDDSDFWILSTFSTPSSSTSSNPPFDLERGSANLQAGCDEGKNHGELFINGYELVFNGTNYQVNDTINPSGFVGQEASYNFISNGGAIPSYSVQKHVPMQTDLIFSGLVDGKIPAEGGDLSIAWTPDVQFPAHGNAAFFFFYSSPNGTVISKHILVDDSDGNLNVSSSFLSDFADVKRVDIMYLKGYQDVELIEGKKIDFRFIGHSWRALIFEGYRPE